MAGYIKVSRKLLDPSHPLGAGRPACPRYAWIDLIGLARWKSGDGLRRGQAEASQRFLAERWSWPRSNVQRFLKQLEGEGMIHRSWATHLGHPISIVTICNYDTYQAGNRESGPPLWATPEPVGHLVGHQAGHPEPLPGNGLGDSVGHQAGHQVGQREVRDEERRLEESTFSSNSPSSVPGSPIKVMGVSIPAPVSGGGDGAEFGELMRLVRDRLYVDGRGPGDRTMKREGSTLKMMLKQGVMPTSIRCAILGLAMMRNEGSLSFAPPGTPLSLGALYIRNVRPLFGQAEDHYRKNGGTE